MTPHRFLRPRTCLPSMRTLRSEPTTAKGIMFCHVRVKLRWNLTEDNLPLTLILSFRRSSSSSFSSVSKGYKTMLWYTSSARIYQDGCFRLLLIVTGAWEELTLCLKTSRSSRVKLSALAITGTTLTTSLSFFMTMISMGLSE